MIPIHSNLIGHIINPIDDIPWNVCPIIKIELAVVSQELWTSKKTKNEVVHYLAEQLQYGAAKYCNPSVFLFTVANEVKWKSRIILGRVAAV